MEKCVIELVVLILLYQSFVTTLSINVCMLFCMVRVSDTNYHRKWNIE